MKWKSWIDFTASESSSGIWIDESNSMKLLPKEREWIDCGWRRAAVQLEWNESWMERTSPSINERSTKARRAAVSRKAKSNFSFFTKEEKLIIAAELLSSSLLKQWATHQLFPSIQPKKVGWLIEGELCCLLFSSSAGYEPEAPLPRLTSIPFSLKRIPFHHPCPFNL